MSPEPVVGTVDPSIDMKTPPKVTVDTMPASMFFAYAAEILKLQPPHVTDQPILAQMRRIGIERGKSFDIDKVDPAIKTGLTTAPEDALKLMAWKIPSIARVANGWSMNTDTRTLADSRGLIAKATNSRIAVVIGASFIGLEVASSLRARGLDVHIVAPETRPMDRVLGPEIGDLVRRVHEEHGVVFHLGTIPDAIDRSGVTLHGGTRLDADLIVVGIGVRPRTALAEQAGMAVDRGVIVNGHLETSVQGIYAAGDIARWPDRLTGEPSRVEHWVVAERQGQRLSSATKQISANVTSSPTRNIRSGRKACSMPAA